MEIHIYYKQRIQLQFLTYDLLAYSDMYNQQIQTGWTCKWCCSLHHMWMFSKCHLHILFLASTHSLQSITRTHKILSIFCLDVLHKDTNTLTQASMEQMPQHSRFIFCRKFLIYWHLHCHVKLTECINWQCSILNYYTVYDSFIFLEVYIYPSPSTNFGILDVKFGIAMMTDILQQKWHSI